MQETITENVVRNTLCKDKRRWKLAKENRKLLETLYYFCNQITSGPMLLKFIGLIHPEWSKSTRERLLSELVRVKLLEQDYFLPSYKQGRVRVLFMTKYAVAFVLKHPNTSKVSMLPKKRRTDWRIETHILRSEIFYQFAINSDYTNTNMYDFRKSCILKASSYGLKGNQEHHYVGFFRNKLKEIKLPGIIYRKELEEEIKYLERVSKKRLDGLKAINQGVEAEPIGTTKKYAEKLSMSPKDEKLPRTKSLEKPLIEDPKPDILKNESIRSVLSLMDIQEVNCDIELNIVYITIDYLVMHSNYSLEKVIENIVNCFKYFTFFIHFPRIQMQFNLYFANRIGYEDFKANVGTAAFSKELTKKGVLLPKTLQFLVHNFEEK